MGFCQQEAPSCAKISSCSRLVHSPQGFRTFTRRPKESSASSTEYACCPTRPNSSRVSPLVPHPTGQPCCSKDMRRAQNRSASKPPCR